MSKSSSSDESFGVRLIRNKRSFSLLVPFRNIEISSDSSLTLSSSL